MEIVIAVFLGVWLAAAGLLACGRLKKEYKGILEKR